MTTTIYRLDANAKKLSQIEPKSMTDLGFKEPYDLEAWLASASDGLFDRNVLWISRQDRLTDDQRSDLIGIDKTGNLLVTELKRGTLDEGAITQALSYVAEYARKTADELATLFADQSARETSTGLVTKAASKEDAQSKLSSHVGTDIELNDAQILLLVGEDFTPGALAICDYLNESIGEGTLSLECWRFTVFQEAANQHIFAMEQILPPPSVRRAIDERREASKAKKYARDPVRKEFMSGLMEYLNSKSPGLATRSRGASYDCWLNKTEWNSKEGVQLSVHGDAPALVLTPGLEFNAGTDPTISSEQQPSGNVAVKFNDIACKSAKFDEPFGERVLKAVERIKPKAISAVTSPGSQSGEASERAATP